jgi:hypothetical protein
VALRVETQHRRIYENRVVERLAVSRCRSSTVQNPRSMMRRQSTARARAATWMSFIAASTTGLSVGRPLVSSSRASHSAVSRRASIRRAHRSAAACVPRCLPVPGQGVGAVGGLHVDGDEFRPGQR